MNGQYFGSVWGSDTDHLVLMVEVVQNGHVVEQEVVDSQIEVVVIAGSQLEEEEGVVDSPLEVVVIAGSQIEEGEEAVELLAGVTDC